MTGKWVRGRILGGLGHPARAIEAETASLEMVKALADYLRRAANEPELRFQAPEAPETSRG